MFIFILVFLLITQFSIMPVYAQNQQNQYIMPDYNLRAEDAIQKARQIELFKDPYWHTLLHYKPLDKGACYKSLIDDTKFFFAKDGKTNPQAELEETIRAFYKLPNEHDKHPTAKFPGRYKFIREKLNLSSTDFPYNGDKEFDELMQKLNPDSAYLIFPAGYLKSPASIFGHTFILIESKGQPRLLANSINYGADSHGVGGILYAIMGLCGGFPAFYGFTPYYERISQYSAIDMRDMWEYKLTFTEEEKEKLIRHIVDMEGIYSRYYFITENCSYNLLFLIEAAKPETRATSLISGAVEPISTVKLIHDLGISNNGVYRPSVFSQVEYYKSFLTKDQNKFVKDVCYGKKSTKDFDFSGVSKESQAAMWDLAAQYLQNLLTEKKIRIEDYRSRYVAVLSARGKLGKIQHEKQMQIPEPPHLSHDSKLLALNAGKSTEGYYSGLTWRLTAHNQLENPTGYKENSQLEFFSFNVRRYSDDSWELNKAYFVNIISLPAVDLYFNSFAFEFLVGAEQNTNEDKESNLAGRFKAFGGYSVMPWNWLQLYLLAGPDAYFNPDYLYYTDLLLGGEAGFISTFGIWKNKMSAQVLQSPVDLSHFRAVFAAKEQLNVERNLSLSAEYSYNMDYDNRWHAFNFGLNINY